MKKTVKTLKKLVLAKETVSQLDASSLHYLAGGKPPITISFCLADSSCTPTG